MSVPTVIQVVLYVEAVVAGALFVLLTITLNEKRELDIRAQELIDDNRSKDEVIDALYDRLIDMSMRLADLEGKK